MGKPEKALLPKTQKYFFNETPVSTTGGLSVVENRKGDGLVEKKESKSEVKELIDLLIKKYVDGNNLRKHKEAIVDSAAKSIHKPILDNELREAEERALGEEIYGMEDLGAHFAIRKTLEERLNNARGVKDRVIIIRILYDMMVSSFQWETGNQRFFIDILKGKIRDKSLPLYVTWYLRVLLNEEGGDLEFWEKGYKENEEVVSFDDQRKRFFYDFHRPKFNHYRLGITPQMATMLNEGRNDDFYFSEFYPIQERLEKDEEYGIEDIYFPGDYIISDLSPKFDAVYTKEGDIVGYLKDVSTSLLSLRAEQWDPLESLPREFSFAFDLFDLASGDVLDENVWSIQKEWLFVLCVKALLGSKRIKEYEEKAGIRVEYNIFLQKKKSDIFNIKISVKDSYNHRESRDIELVRKELKRIAREEIAHIDFSSIPDKEKRNLEKETAYENISDSDFISNTFYNPIDDPRPTVEVGSFEELIDGEIIMDNDVFLLKLMLSLPFRIEIKKRLGIDIASLDLKNQHFFLQYIGKKTESDFRNTRKFIENGQSTIDRINRAKSFLSLEFGQDLSEDLFVISENLDSEQADLIFAKYAEITDLAYAAEDLLLESVAKKEKAEVVDFREISHDLLRRGKDILKNFADEVRLAQQKGIKIKTNEIIDILEDYHRDLVFQAAAIKEGKKRGLGFREFIGARFRIMTTKEIAQEPKLHQRMHEYYRRNWQRKPSIQAKALKGFDARIEQGKDDVIFFVFERGGKLAAFSGAENLNSERVHFFGFNVNPAMQGSKIGWDLKELSVNFVKERKDENDPVLSIFGDKKEIEIECDPTDSRSTPVYVLKDGYVITGTSKEFGEDLLFKAVMEFSPKDYFFRGKSKEEIIEFHIKNNLNNKFNPGDDKFILKFKPGSEEMKKAADKLLDQEHYRITSYFFDRDKKRVYCAFERGGSES